MADAHDQTPELILVPVEGLRLTRPWSVGRVTFHPGAAGRSLIANAPPFDSPDDWVRKQVLRILDSAADSSIAAVPGSGDVADVMDEVRSSVDALRLFQQSRTRTRTTSFGLHGDLYASRIEYVALGERSASGGRVEGDPLGWTFSEDAKVDWEASRGFQFLSEALADPGRSDGARRAVVGSQLLARAVREHRPDLTMIGVAAALEAMLLTRQASAQTWRLARHVSWFGCGSSDGDLCGRSRPICPYLHLDPSDGADRRRLGRLRVLGNQYAGWRCSEWHRVVDWYDARSDAAHGDLHAVSKEQASRAEYWAVHHLLEPILEWLSDHREDPILDLKRELDSVDEPAGWSTMLAALDSSKPPASPPAL
jgi:hypothetical protein